MPGFKGIVDFVGSTSNEAISSTTVVASMPSGIEEGDTVLIFCAASQSSSFTIDSVTTGYTEEDQSVAEGDTGVYNALGVYSKVAGVSEGSATVTWSTSMSSSLVICMVYRNVSVGALVQAPTNNFVNNTDTNASNNWEDNNGIAVVGWFGNMDGTGVTLGITTAPTGMTNQEQISGTGTRTDIMLVVYDDAMSGRGPLSRSMIWDTTNCASHSTGMELRA